jgi:hypothetical protein
MAVMTSALPRTLTLLCLVFLASAGRAESPASPSGVGASDGAAKQRRWFSFLKKPQVQHTTRDSPLVVSSVVLASLLGGGAAAWLVLRIVHHRIRAGRASDAKMQEKETAALLGILIGFPAGMCIYDKLCPHSEKAEVSDAS